MKGVVREICIADAKGEPMRDVSEVTAIAGQGLKGDRYARGEGSFNNGTQGTRQVTLMNATFFQESDITFSESRRNLLVEGVELMWLIGREFQVGTAKLRGVKYCDPCERPNRLSGNPASFKHAFSDRGGLLAEVIETGVIRVGGQVIPPPKAY